MAAGTAACPCYGRIEEHPIMHVVKRIAIVLLALAVTIAHLPASEPAASPKTAPPADVVVEVYSDFQCPFCAQFAAPIRELQAKGVEGLTTKVSFRHFPLSFHADAQLAHQAAVAARKQNKFWE